MLSRVKKLGFPPFEGKDGDRRACLHCGSMPADAFKHIYKDHDLIEIQRVVCNS